MSDISIVICCSPATAPFTIRDSVFTHECVRCKQRVMLSPQGQTFLKQHAEAKLMCIGCYAKEDKKADRFGTVADPKEMIQEVKRNTVANFWRKRN